ncbi:MAG: Chaperone protein HtpG [Candidatus Anoxychlamydiales bacterium]|nr:Chaperone protein HtpG [Candidatus Anoxychlamydiales bacterium]
MEKDLSIHSENILPIIKKWLYSEKDIFLRELVSNSSDAISKLKIIDSKIKDFRIDIKIDKKENTLTIVDNGIGMSFDEVEKYISQIAFSGAEEFLKKYESGDQKDQIIGHFGLGFYSTFMVSEKVQIKTQSHNKKEDSVLWTSNGSSKYLIEKTKKVKRGCEITLFIEKDNFDVLDEEKIKTILLKYCLFFSYPIYLNDKHINNKDPLWLKNASETSDKEYLEFYKDLYPFEPDPIFWIHLNVDYPFNLKGILYFPKITNNFDTNKNHVKLFSNRVFVSESAKEILPKFLTMLKGAIDSPDIPLNVSRSYLQVDSNIKKLSTHISKKILDKLSNLYKLEKDKYISYWPDIEVIIKLGILDDEKFYEKAKEFLIFENHKKEWTTIEEYIERSDKKDKIFYSSKDKSTHLLDLYTQKNIEVLYLNAYIDTAIISFLEQKLNVKFTRIDGSIDASILDTSKDKNVLDKDGRSLSSKISDFFKDSIDADLEVESKSLSSSDISSFIMVNEEERRLKDYMQFTQNANLPSKSTLVINTNNKLIDKIYSLHQIKPKLAKNLARDVYDTALLSQKELKPEDFSTFISRSTKNLEELLDLIK